jgi:hypothetical protein
MAGDPVWLSGVGFLKKRHETNLQSTKTGDEKVMPYPQELEYWSEEVSIAFPQLSRSQSRVLSLYSYGMAMTKSCGQMLVSVFLALFLTLKPQNLRQQLREFTYEKAQKRGQKRFEIAVNTQFDPLLRWVLQPWQDKKKLVFAADVTDLADRHTILTISVLYGQTAMPVACARRMASVMA